MSTPLAADSYSIAQAIDAWEGSLRAVNELAKRLNDEGWAAPTECPGWTVGDVVRHLCWVEARLAGRPDLEPETPLDYDALPHVRSDLSRTTETGVAARRNLAQAQVCAELDGLIDVRLAQIMALDPIAPGTEVPSVSGRTTTLGFLLRIRAFDTWTHEQDVRRAVGLPGNFATPGAQQSAAQVAASVPHVLGRGLGAPVGTTLRVRVSGKIEFERAAQVVEDGTAEPVDAVAVPSVAIATDWETYARLSAGRLDVADPAVLARLELSGDPALAAALPAALVLTP
jgi:uncharacterized protein (TIGR03083 family)